MADTTGLTEFIEVQYDRDLAWAAELPERARALLESLLRVVKIAVDEHGPDPHLALGGEPLCVGCVEDVPWPCDFALHTVRIWRDEPGYRQEWGDALNPLANHTN